MSDALASTAHSLCSQHQVLISLSTGISCYKRQWESHFHMQREPSEIIPTGFQLRQAQRCESLSTSRKWSTWMRGVNQKKGIRHWWDEGSKWVEYSLENLLVFATLVKSMKILRDCQNPCALVVWCACTPKLADQVLHFMIDHIFITLGHLLLQRGV